MRKILILIQKEFKQVLRDKMILAIIFAVPILQLLILPWAIDLDVRHVSISIVDMDKSSYSRDLISKFSATETFNLYSYYDSYKNAIKDLQENKVDIILTIPANFERNLIRNNGNQLSVSTNAINGVKAMLGTYYLNMIIRDFNQDIVLKWYPQIESVNRSTIEVRPAVWYNQSGDYKHFMVPAILVLLLTVVAGFLTALNIVKEKEIGTIEQINVTPIKKWQFIIGKLVPFWIISNIVYAIGLLIMVYLYGITIKGSVGLLVIYANVYTLSILGLGLIISALAHTQQQAMFVNYFFTMILLLMSGLFTSIESMPQWAQYISYAIPISYFIEASRAIIIKGAGFAEISNILLILGIFVIVLNGVAILTYKKSS